MPNNRNRRTYNPRGRRWNRRYANRTYYYSMRGSRYSSDSDDDTNSVVSGSSSNQSTEVMDSRHHNRSYARNGNLQNPARNRGGRSRNIDQTTADNSFANNSATTSFQGTHGDFSNVSESNSSRERNGTGAFRFHFSSTGDSRHGFDARYGNTHNLGINVDEGIHGDSSNESEASDDRERNGINATTRNMYRESEGYSSEPSASTTSSHPSSPVSSSRASTSAINTRSLEEPRPEISKCAVCLESYQEIQKKGAHIVRVSCGHVFCDICTRVFLSSRSCPKCRSFIARKTFRLYF